ncbi:hypothetical protein BGZ58_001617 [Dissophora ornata]|nr:hypothetical protein BGZ58_001617 [Dissophora ornata]
MGRWSMGQMVVYYLPKNPAVGAFYMAHFNKIGESYFIKRDLVTPLLPLQHLSYPLIERAFNKDMPWRTDSWIKECDQGVRSRNGRIQELEDFAAVISPPILNHPQHPLLLSTKSRRRGWRGEVSVRDDPSAIGGQEQELEQ